MSPKTYKLLYLGEVPGELARRLQQAGPGVQVVSVERAEEALRHVADAEVIAGSGRLFTAELVAAAPKLRWVQAMSAGA